MLTWMGFLGQELPGSIICDECTCSHMPMYNRRCTYLRLHVFVHPPLGTCSRWVNAHRSLPPVSCGMLPRNGTTGSKRVQTQAQNPCVCNSMVLGSGSCTCRMQPLCAQAPGRVGGHPHCPLWRGLLGAGPVSQCRSVPRQHQHWLLAHAARPNGSEAELRGVETL